MEAGIVGQYGGSRKTMDDQIFFTNALVSARKPTVSETSLNSVELSWAFFLAQGISDRLA